MCETVALVSNRHCRVITSSIIHHRQCYISDAIASVPADAHAVAANRSTIDSGQLVHDDVIAGVIITVAVENELGVCEPVAAIVEHRVGPVEAKQRNITQVDYVIGIAVNVVTVAIEVVEGLDKVSTKHDVQNAVDDRSSGVGMPSYRDCGAIP